MCFGGQRPDPIHFKEAICVFIEIVPTAIFPRRGISNENISIAKFYIKKCQAFLVVHDLKKLENFSF